MAFVGRSDVKDPGAEQDQWERLTRRRERLYADDEQFLATRPDDQIAVAAHRPALRIAEIMAIVLQRQHSGTLPPPRNGRPLALRADTLPTRIRTR
jgi:hypothetical protein